MITRDLGSISDEFDEQIRSISSFLRTGAEPLLGFVAEQLRLVESVGADSGQRYEQDRGGDRSNSAIH